MEEKIKELEKKIENLELKFMLMFAFGGIALIIITIYLSLKAYILRYGSEYYFFINCHMVK
jgi:hypothetical protein